MMILILCGKLQTLKHRGAYDATQRSGQVVLAGPAQPPEKAGLEEEELVVD